eukprot:scaffold80991_cov52-Cyclotella_meneghiniana.AAC.2
MKKRSRAEEILEEASKRAKTPGVTIDPLVTVILSKELSEEEAMTNWCSNVDLDCLVSNEARSGSKSNTTDELLGESIQSPNLPPHHHSSSMEEPPPPPPQPAIADASREVDCRVSTGLDCSVPPSQVSHQSNWCVDCLIGEAACLEPHIQAAAKYCNMLLSDT